MMQVNRTIEEKMNVLVTRAIPDEGIAILKRVCTEVEVSPHVRAVTGSELISMARGRDGLLTMVTDPVNATLLDACPTIRAISNFGVGINNIDVAECTRRKIGVANTPGVLTDATAETAWALIFAVARRVVEGESMVRSGKWEGWGPMQCLGMGITGKTLGIIGAGRIGQRVAEMSRGFGMRILYHSRTPRPDFERSTNATRVDMETLLRTADIISVHTPLSPETRHLIGAEQLAMMKPTAILINTARGPVIDEAALVEALRAKRIFAAGLDVYEREPQLTPGLRELTNVVLLPHIGSGIIETRTRMATMAAEHLIAMLQGQRPTCPVNPELWRG